jgi:hypothetical protein
MSESKKQSPIDIELTAEVAEGIYSNLAIITHSASEFFIDFVRLLPGVPKNPVKSRIILTPQHAKRLMEALEDNVRKYEGRFGDIKDPQQTIDRNMFMGQLPVNEA